MKFFIFITFISIYNLSCWAATNQDDIAGLMDLYKSTQGDNWHHKDNWGTGDPCDDKWRGVGCDGSDPKRVNKILLAGNNLEGPLPASINKLSALVQIDLHSNAITGELPSPLDFPQLNVLLMNSNRLEGSTPDLSACIKLSKIHLSHNKLEEHHPSLWTLPNLQELLLDFNHFKSIEHAEILLPKLHTWNMNNNALTGAIPSSINGSLALNHLDLSHNRLKHKLDFTFFGQLHKLRVLILGENHLSGNLHEGIFSVKARFDHLDLSHNHFHGSISWLKDLQFSYKADLSLHHNRFEGKFPAVCEKHTLNRIEIHNNLMTEGFDNLLACRLHTLDVSYNRFHGDLPDTFQHGLVELNLSSNEFTGSIPPTLLEVNTLRSLKCEHNHIIGSFAFPKSHTLDHVDMSDNNLSGKLPAQWPHSLTSVDLSNNNFDSGLPEKLEHMGELDSLRLSNAGLSGPIPKWLNDVHYPMDLRNNHFICPIQGKLPSNVHVSCHCGPGTHTPSLTTACEPCAAGTYMSSMNGAGADCVSCLDGYTSSEGATECTAASAAASVRVGTTLFWCGLMAALGFMAGIYVSKNGILSSSSSSGGGYGGAPKGYQLAGVPDDGL